MTITTLRRVGVAWSVSAFAYCAAGAVFASTVHNRLFFALMATINAYFIAALWWSWWSDRRAQRCVLTVGVRVNAFGRCFIVKSVSGRNVVLDELREVE